MRVTIDFETRSACNLKACGSYVYSEHPTTEVLCLGFKFAGKMASILGPRDRSSVEDLLNSATEIWAHNAGFEVAIWQNVCAPKYGWPPLPLDKVRCSGAVVAMHSLPRSLDGACKALGLPIQKDGEGHRLMLKLCKPRRPRKGEDPDALLWHEDPKDMDRLFEYCEHDVEAEEAIMDVLRCLPPSELKTWKLDQVINRRGIQADLTGAKAMAEMIEEHERRLLERLGVLTNGSVRTAKQVEAMRRHLLGLDADLPDLSAATVKEFLARPDLNPDARQILAIRQSLGRTSGAKYRSILDRASRDGRVRGSLLYHGASTGRWSGSGVQPHNFPSRIKISDDPATMLETVVAGGIDLFQALYDDDPMTAAGAVTRSVLCAADGKDLVVADFNAIEGRGLAWLAGEETELAVYRSGKDVYIANAAKILGKKYEDVTTDERSRIGKVSCLAAGYQGSVGACRKFGCDDMTDDEIKEKIVNPWREAHPMTVRFWYDLEDANLKAVEEPGIVTRVRSIQMVVHGGFLQIKLPNGRILYYYDPQVDDIETNWGQIKPAVTYMTVDTMTKQWIRTSTYGGKICENICQATCRDVMAEAMHRAEANHYPIVITVHDEIVSEVPEGYGSVEEFENIMAQVPTWAPGFPIVAKGWRGKRYKK